MQMQQIVGLYLDDSVCKTFFACTWIVYAWFLLLAYARQESVLYTAPEYITA